MQADVILNEPPPHMCPPPGGGVHLSPPCSPLRLLNCVFSWVTAYCLTLCKENLQHFTNYGSQDKLFWVVFIIRRYKKNHTIKCQYYFYSKHY